MTTLLSIIELGGYPDFTALYEKTGCEVKVVNSVRKAISFLKKNPVDIIVAEFNYQTDFRDRTSSLESLMAVLQAYPESKVIIFLDGIHQEKLAKVTSRFNIFASQTFPIDEEQLEKNIVSVIKRKMYE